MIYPLTYVFLACMFISIFSQLHFLAKALQEFDAMYVVPVFQCFFISVSTIAGAAYFGEFSEFDVAQACSFPLGIGLTLFGVYILSSRDMSKTGKRLDNDMIESVAVNHKVKRGPSMHFYDKDLVKNKRESKYGILALHDSQQVSRSRGTSLDDDSFDVDSSMRRSSGISLLTGRRDQLASDIDHQNFAIDSYYYAADAQPDVLEETVVVDDNGNGRVVYTDKLEDSAVKEQKIQEAQASLLKNSERVRSSSVGSVSSHHDSKSLYQSSSMSVPAMNKDHFRSPQASNKAQSSKILRGSAKSKYARMRAESLDKTGSVRSKRASSSHGTTQVRQATVGGGAFMDNLIMMGKAENVLIDKWAKIPSMPMPPIPTPLVRPFSRMTSAESGDVESQMVPSDIVSDAQMTTSYGSVGASDVSDRSVSDASGGSNPRAAKKKKNKKKKHRRVSYVTGEGKLLQVHEILPVTREEEAVVSPSHASAKEWFSVETTPKIGDLEDTDVEDEEVKAQQ
jgi:hypothetical protein